MNFLMLLLIQSLKAETRVNTEGFLSLMQPGGPKLTTPCTSQVVFVPAASQAKGPPESPCRRTGKGSHERFTVQVRRCIGEHWILTAAINHLCALEFVKVNLYQKCDRVFLREANANVVFYEALLKFKSLQCCSQVFFLNV